MKFPTYFAALSWSFTEIIPAATLHYISNYHIAMFHYLCLGSNEISLTADTKYPALDGAFQLTCTLDTGQGGKPLKLHRQTGVGNGIDCGQCNPPSYNGVIGPCTDTTNATYNVQCTVEGTAITMEFDVTGASTTEIGQWTCNIAIGAPTEAGIIITELGKAYM